MEYKFRQVEGKNPVMEALKSQSNIEKIMIAKGRRETSYHDIIEIAKDKNIKLQYVDRKKLDFISKTNSHQGIIAVANNYSYVDIEDILQVAKDKGEDPFLLILDKITDPHNFGAMIRTASACGMHGIIIPKHNSANITPTVSKASSGAIEHISICKVTNLANTIDLLKEKGLWIAGADLQGEVYYNKDLKGPIALIIGSEGKGVSKLVKKHCDFLLTIPMYGMVESLNASVASGIIISEACRQRQN